MYSDASVFCLTRECPVTILTQIFALELETETELEFEAELPLEFDLELVDNFHAIHFLEVLSIFTTTTFIKSEFMHFYLMHFFRVSGSTRVTFNKREINVLHFFKVSRHLMYLDASVFCFTRESPVTILTQILHLNLKLNSNLKLNFHFNLNLN